VVNSTANLFPEESGSATELAMLKFINRCGINIKKTRDDATIVQKMPFSSTRKRTSTICMISGNVKIFVKGASEIVLDSCSHMQGFSG
jgi:Ca2+ transporting ATPase